MRLDTGHTGSVLPREDRERTLPDTRASWHPKF